MNKIESKFNKSQIFLSSSAHLVTDMYASFIIGLIPVLAAKFSLSLFLVGILTSVNYISNSLTQPIFGYLSDKYGSRFFIISGPLFASIFISLLGILPNYYFILIFLFLGNLSVSAIHPPTAAAAYHFGGSRKGFGNSIISGSVSVPPLLAQTFLINFIILD